MGLKRWFAHLGFRLREIIFCRLGSFHLKRGDLLRARNHFLRVLQDEYDSYDAHFGLGKIYLRQDRLARAVEELRQAQRIDPQRFSREGFPADPRLWMTERQPGFQISQNRSSSGLTSATASHFARPKDGLREESTPADPSLGDFSSQDEQDRFSSLPPIRPEELESIDWDRLLHELGEND